MRGERRIGGLLCSEVLERLADYVDDELEMESRRQIESHLQACDVCERFGGEYAAAVRQVRLQLAAADPMDERSSRALHKRVLRRIT